MTPEETLKLDAAKDTLEILMNILKAANIPAETIIVGVDDTMVMHRERKTEHEDN